MGPRARSRSAGWSNSSTVSLSVDHSQAKAPRCARRRDSAATSRRESGPNTGAEALAAQPVATGADPTRAAC